MHSLWPPRSTRGTLTTQCLPPRLPAAAEVPRSQAAGDATSSCRGAAHWRPGAPAGAAPLDSCHLGRAKRASAATQSARRGARARPRAGVARAPAAARTARRCSGLRGAQASAEGGGRSGWARRQPRGTRGRAPASTCVAAGGASPCLRSLLYTARGSPGRPTACAHELRSDSSDSSVKETAGTAEGAISRTRCTTSSRTSALVWQPCGHAESSWPRVGRPGPNSRMEGKDGTFISWHSRKSDAQSTATNSSRGAAAHACRATCFQAGANPVARYTRERTL